MWMGAWGRRLPPSWDGGRCAIPVVTRDGDCIGKILPGRGLYFEQDLKYNGITRNLPNVFERSLVQRFMDKFYQNDRFSIAAAAACVAGLLSPAMVFTSVTSMDDILQAITNGQEQNFEVIKSGTTTTVNGAWFTLARSSGPNPPVITYTAVPGGAALDNSTSGSWGIGIMNPIPTGKKCYLTQFAVQTGANNTGGFLLVDLLVAAGSISTNTTTPTTVNSAALTRFTTGAGVMMTFDITTALGATASNITVSYTNQAGTAGQTTPAQAMTTSGTVQRLQPISVTSPIMQLAAQDYGVRAVASVTMSAAMLAGVIALNLFVPLLFMPGVAGTYYIERDLPQTIDGVLELVQTSGGNTGCTTVFILAGATSSGILDFHMKTVVA